MDRLSQLKSALTHGRQGGFTLYEVIGALAIGTMMMVGLSTLIDNSIDDAQGQQAALYQAQVAAAASKYITDNYSALLATASTTVARTVTLATLQANESYLAGSHSATNAYGQTPCVLILKNANSQLNALVVTEGGLSIPSHNLAYVSANAGQSGGYIQLDSANQPEAKGAFSSWKLNSAALAPYLTATCSGTTAGANHLATALFFNGPGQPSTDYLYRDAVTGHPELNQMNTPLHIVNSNVIAVENQSDINCAVGTPATYGGISTNAAGEVLSCQSGVWKRQNGYWKEPVAEYASLPATGNTTGDVRLIKDKNLAFAWNGTSWNALAVDNSGNLTMTGRLTTNDILLNSVQTAFTACTTNGTIARDSTGLLLSCKSGIWRSMLDTYIDPNYTAYSWIKYTADGNGSEDIDLSAIPGNRPLYTSGYVYCNSEDNSQVVGAVEIHDASSNILGWSGGCGSIASTARVDTKGFMSLTKLPANATRLHVTWWPRNGDPGNYVQVFLRIYSSQ